MCMSPSALLYKVPFLHPLCDVIEDGTLVTPTPVDMVL